MTPDRADKLAKRLRLAIGRHRHGRSRMKLTLDDMQSLLEFVEAYADEKRLIGPDDVMRATGLTRDRLRNAVSSGALPCTRLPSGFRRFSKQDVRDFVRLRALAAE